jgi:hypothetical protein
MRQTASPITGASGRPARTFAIAIVMFAAILAWRFADPNPVSAINSLYVVPIALLAVTLGTRGGLAGAAPPWRFLSSGHRSSTFTSARTAISLEA